MKVVYVLCRGIGCILRARQRRAGSRLGEQTSPLDRVQRPEPLWKCVRTLLVWGGGKLLPCVRSEVPSELGLPIKLK